MTRKKREQSDLDIYHVMLRGINKQDIFLEEEDYKLLLDSMEEVQIRRGPDGRVLGRDNCTYYAYCILHNHAHILLREGQLPLSELMKRLQDRFVVLYNRNYERVGHLFQDRFASEPVNDQTYFLQLLRYIHRNPVKAMEASAPEDYRYSSWHEYLGEWTITGSDPLIVQLCDTAFATDIMGRDRLVEWVNEDVYDNCMDMDTFRQPMSDTEAWARLRDLSKVDNVEDFKQLAMELQLEYIAQLVGQGASIRQSARLSSLSYRKLWNKLNPEKYQEIKDKKKAARRKA